MVPLRFLVQHGSYQPGEVAGFPAGQASALVAGGVAVPAGDPSPAEPAAPAAASPSMSAAGHDRRAEPARRRRRSPVVTKDQEG